MIPCPPMNVRSEIKVRVRVRRSSGRRELCTLCYRGVTLVRLMLLIDAPLLLNLIHCTFYLQPESLLVDVARPS